MFSHVIIFKMNDTILKFGYPHSLLKEFKYWIVLLRPKQVTVGSLVLACKEDAESLGSVTEEAYKELNIVTKDLEDVLNRAFNIEKINYLALMMIDKQVHFHVIPRYSSVRMLGSTIFDDKSWPKPPDLSNIHNLSEAEFYTLKNYLLKCWK